MERDQAIQSALGARPRFQIPAEFGNPAAEKRVIEIVQNGSPVSDELPTRGPVKDLMAWVITLESEGSTVELAIDDSTGEVVRFRRSRSAVTSFKRKDDGNE